MSIKYFVKIIKNIKQNGLYQYKYKFIQHIMRLIVNILPVNKKLVFFECFLGQSYGDSPKYIYEEMLKRRWDKSYTIIWALKPEKMDTQIPGKHKKVNYLGFKYFYYMLRSKYIVNNSRFPYFVTVNPRSVFMQTWHGTPLKRLGLDQEEVYMPNTTTQRYKMNILRSSSEWDYMISQNSFSSERFCSAFGVDSDKIIEIGYPRDDILSLGTVEKDARIKSIKQSLNIPLDKKVLLYAPTFRDDDTNGKKYRHTLPFDINNFADEIGDEYVVVLRLHYLISQTLGENTKHPRVVDASNYNDITQLYLISDVMVTDYSSVMFDFSITRRPMLFYMYDIVNYRDKLRGFYFEIDTLPGPIISSYFDFVEAVKNIDTINVHYQQKYDDFVAKFTYLDDGTASAKAVDILFKN